MTSGRVVKRLTRERYTTESRFTDILKSNLINRLNSSTYEVVYKTKLGNLTYEILRNSRVDELRQLYEKLTTNLTKFL